VERDGEVEGGIMTAKQARAAKLLKLQIGKARVKFRRRIVKILRNYIKQQVELHRVMSIKLTQKLES